MANLNRCDFIGNVGRDPEVRYLANGTAVASLSLAVSERFKNKSGEYEDRTEWVNLVFWSKLAEIVGQMVAKGAQLYVSGSCRTRKWQDKTGADRYSTEFHCDKMQLLGSKGDAKGGGSGGASRDEPMYHDEGEIPFISGPSFYDHR